MRRYVVNEVTTGFLPGPRELDSVGELSFASLADYRERLYDSGRGRKIVSADVAKFIGGADAHECTQHVRKGRTGRAVRERRGRAVASGREVAAVP